MLKRKVFRNITPEEAVAAGWTVISDRPHAITGERLLTCEGESELLEFHTLKALRLKVLAEENGNRRAAAQRLGISTRTLYNWLKVYDALEV